MSKLEHLNSWHSDWSQLKAVVYGLGVTGFSVADTLAELGATVLVISDKAERNSLDVLDVLGVSHLVGFPKNDIEKAFREFQADVVITSPGIKPDSELLIFATNSNIPIWTDIDLAWRVRDKSGKSSQWVCITGTNGKTTVTQLVEQMLLSAGIKAVSCGNIGVPILDVVRDPAEFEVLVVELSSFQLHYLNEIKPLVSAVLNIADDHLDWHGSFDSYASTKGKIYNNTSVCCVYNVADALTSELMHNAVNCEEAQAVGFTVNTPAPNEIGWVEDLLVDRAFIDDPSVAEELATLDDLKHLALVSPHLMSNIAAASAISRAVGVQPAEIAQALRGFQLDAHRIELVLEKDGVQWVDDSKATNPHAAAAALATFDSVIWVVGGLLKGVDVSPLVQRYAKKIKAAIVIGLDRAPVLAALMNYAADSEVIEIDVPSELVMNEVVLRAKAIAVSGDTVLLAPAAASMDQFNNYADRGQAFVQAITKEVM
ncbi:MAG: UDP-N-acetylmuramoyl-L-alanine--D-glutamate ligase [Actinobacteria bacterium]|nr:UDP-N-acetylmuramoyl-L-alanine--D-glutamate ligase [Actinomycetota bacterium]